MARGAVRLGAVLVVAAMVMLALGMPSEAREITTGDDTDGPAAMDDPGFIARWIDNEVLPIPRDTQVPLSTLRGRGGSGWASFRASFPPMPVWDPLGPKRVGLQAGHWECWDAPDELSDLRSNPGTSGGGLAEWEVTLDIAQRTAEILRAAGVEVDVLPTTIPVRYRAHAFVAIHADGDPGGILDGYKVASPGFTSIQDTDDVLVAALNDEYGPATGLTRQDNQVSLRMRWYYAFNARRYQHAVAPDVPQAIIETGFLTNYSDRRVLVGDPDRAARGIADGILRFLERDTLGGVE